ncbi:MAG: hypothetical protein ACI3XH_04030 [Phascolarctobacterium sp.]
MINKLKNYICLLMLLFSFSTASVCGAGYSIYLNNDKNYILCDGHMGQGWYIVRDSLAVEKYEPPEYIISVEMVAAESAVGSVEDFYNGGIGKITNCFSKRFKYNWDAKTMFVEYNKDWRYLNPVGCWAESGVFMPAGEIAFALAYNMKFYGSQKYYIEDLSQYVDAFDKGFYDRVGL